MQTEYAAMTNHELVKSYNDMVEEAESIGLTGYRPTQRFKDCEAGVKRCEMLASSLRARRQGDAEAIATHEERGAERARAEGRSRTGKNPPRPKTAKPKTVKKAKKPMPEPAAEPTRRTGTKTDMVRQMLLHPDGCTADEVKRACGWPSVSMPAMAAAAGLVLRKEEDEGGMRYYGTIEK